MLTLESKITLDEAAIHSANLCDRFKRADLDKIGLWVLENYTRDKGSRKDWEKRTEAALDLAMQVQKEKSFPWPNCSNIAFPLVTIAALQFHARAYPAIINGRTVVQCRVIGGDPEGLAKERADRISSHMSWQLLEQDEAWEEETDRALLNVAIVGVGWKKSYYDSSRGYNVSEFVQAKDLVVDYWAKSVDSAMVKTHVIPMYRNTIYERCRRGSYYDVLGESWFQAAQSPRDTTSTEDADRRSGVVQPDTDFDTPFTILEQHCWIDLDDDGYAEPYIITVDEGSSTVLRIVTRFDRIEDIEYNHRKQIIRISPMEYFTKIPFVPSPDGSLMDIGFGRLIGPLNESVNSSINQLFDSGTMCNTGGGFLGRGAKIKGGVYQFQPFGWNRVDSTGDDLRKNIFPLPVREPSGVMFNLLGLLIDYTNRISGSTDMLAGENPGQNTPAETSRALLDQGQKVYSAIFKRVWRSMKQEFKKLYTLNGIYLPARAPFGDGGEIRREDYSVGGLSVVPIADPTISSDGAKFAQARMVKEAAAGGAGYAADPVERMYLKALGVDNVEEIYPGVENMPEPAPDIKIQIQQMKNEQGAMELENAKMQFILTMQENQRINNAKIMQLEAQARKMDAEAQSEPGKQNVIAFRAGIEAVREQNKVANEQLDRLMENYGNEARSKSRGISGMAGSSSDQAPDALGLPEEGIAP